MIKLFESVRSNHPSRSFFDLSYDKKFDCDMGELIPVMCDEVVPGDVFKIGCQAVVRLAPMVAPILHEINLYVHYFFVPYRLLWNIGTHHDLGDVGSWEEFITGGTNGADASVIPRWDGSGLGAYTLWDYFGFPLVANLNTYTPTQFPLRAYNLVYNEYYRDENVTAPIALTTGGGNPLKRAWEKDYFTSALPWQQRGTAPGLPISGTTAAVWNEASFVNSSTGGTAVRANASVPPSLVVDSSANRNAMRDVFAANTVDLGVAATFDVSDLRLAFQIQKWMERNARAGVRYTEFLKAHFGVSPRDERLNRPEYIGGSKTPIIVSEVLQTSKTDTVAPASPQGNMAGHGIGVSRQFCGKYHAQEFGVIIGIMSIMPRALYQQGINRQWMRRTKYDFYFPEFANLSEQAIENGEIYVTSANDAVNTTTFGYQGRYDEMRVKHNMVVAGMRDTFDYWHLSRQFASVPTRNTTFMECLPRKDCFAAPSAKCCFVSFGNIIQAFRPMPAIAEPGLIDHD